MSPLTFLLLYHITQISSMLQVYSVTDYKKCQNVVGISDTLTMPSVPLKFYRTFFHYL